MEDQEPQDLRPEVGEDSAGSRDEPDWAAYYRYTAGRAPRPLFGRAVDAWAATGRPPGQAIEVGFGDGTETLELLSAGWRVLAIDAQQAASDVLGPRVPAPVRERLEIAVASAEAVDLPAADLVYSGFSLPYLGRERLSSAWPRLRAALSPGGLLAVNLFGVNDEWAGEDGVAFQDRATVEAMLDGLDVLELDEREEDAGSFCGPKHWHLFDIVARRPPEPGR